MEDVRDYVASLIVVLFLCVGFGAAAPPSGRELTRVYLRIGTAIDTTQTVSVTGITCEGIPFPAWYGFFLDDDGYDPCGFGWLAVPDLGYVEFQACASWVASVGVEAGNSVTRYWFFDSQPSVSARVSPVYGGDRMEEIIDGFRGCLMEFSQYCDPSFCGNLVALGPGDYARWAASNAFLDGYITVVLVGYCQGVGEIIQWVGYYYLRVDSGGSVSVSLLGSDSGDVSALTECVRGWVGDGDNETSVPFNGSTPPGNGGTSGGSTPPDNGGTSGGSTPPDGGGTSGGSTPPDNGGTSGGSTPPDNGGTSGGSTPPDGGGTSGGSTPPDGGGSVDGVPLPPVGGPSGGVPTSPDVPEGPKVPGDVAKPTPGHPCFGGDNDSVYFVAPAGYEPRTEFGESVVYRSGDGCEWRDVIKSGDVVVANSGDVSADDVNQLIERVRSGAGVTRVVVPRFEKDYVVVRQRIADAVAHCDGVVRVVEQTSEGWDRPEVLASAGREDLLFNFGGEIPELFRVEELEVSVIRQKLESMGEASFNGQNVLSVILESADRPQRVTEVRGSVVVCDRSLSGVDLATSVSSSSREVDSVFGGVERRLRSFADSMSGGLVTALAVEPCSDCPPLPVPQVQGSRVVWAEDRRWCLPLNGARGSLRLGAGAGVLVAILGLWLRFWAFITGGGDS